MRPILGILVGGGPAPGINSVIGAATIRANQHNLQVLGILEGFKWLMQNKTDQVVPLATENVSRIHFQGGSILGTARDNPTKDASHIRNVVDVLHTLGIKYLITIGGDDTLYSAREVSKVAQDISVVHVPKTIDNDLNLPHGQSTFGYQTARHLGVQLVKNLMNDAQTTHRWYFITSMGRKAGLLALGMGKAAGATLTLIPEEFEPGTPLQKVVDTLLGSIIKRYAYGQRDGVVVIAEGIIERIRPKDLEQVATAERDAHGHIRFSEIQFGNLIKHYVQKELKSLSIPTSIVATNIGYELRCADPIPFDMAYTRDLGYLATTHLLEGGNQVVITVENMLFKPIPFDQMMDPTTGKSKVRLVELSAPAYAIARSYMIRLTKQDLSQAQKLKKLCDAIHWTESQFKERFEYVST